MRRHKILLDENELPTRWYNVLHDLPTPLPPVLHPGTGQPVGPDDLAPLFPTALIEQEVTSAQYVEIPGDVLDVYRLWRPSPLFRAHRLEAALGTPARIYYKYEGVSPAGSHKPNTAVPQAFYNAQAGIRRLTTETGAGQWGSALAFACAQYGLDCEVWQVRASYDQKPYRKIMIETFGGDRAPQPVDAHGRGPGDPGRAPRLDRVARDRDQRGRRGRRPGPEHQLRAGQRAQPRAAAPDRDRGGGTAAARAGGGDPGPARRLHRRRLELRRPRCSRSSGSAGPGG